MRALVILSLMLAAIPVRAEPVNTRFVSIAYHDVVDRREDRTDDAVTSESLVRFFDWLKGDGWTPVSLDDIAAANAGTRSLPDKAILITFDDGYRSLYTRVYPLLRAYHYPAVAALVGHWLDAPDDEMVSYGDHKRPRRDFVHWDEVRTMVASGLVEVASHGYAIHDGIQANPQGNRIPSAATWAWDPVTRRQEDDKAFLVRIRADLEHSRQQIARETGKPPRALVWPFGRYAGPALEMAKQLGFAFDLTLEPEPADANKPDAIPRYYPVGDPSLGEIANNLSFNAPRASTIRLICVSLDEIAAAPDLDSADQQLGRVLEQVQTTGANVVLIDASPRTDANNKDQPTLTFPNSQLPVSKNVLARVVWQFRTRIGVDVYLGLSLAKASSAVGPDGVPRLAADMMRATLADGLVVEGSGVMTARSIASGTPWSTRAARATGLGGTSASYSLLAARTIAAAEAIEPRLRVMLTASTERAQGPPVGVDYLLIPPPLDATKWQPRLDTLKASGWLSRDTAGQIIFELPAVASAKAMRAAQAAGATGFGLCPLPEHTDVGLAPVFSAATGPRPR